MWKGGEQNDWISANLKDSAGTLLLLEKLLLLLKQLLLLLEQLLLLLEQLLLLLEQLVFLVAKKYSRQGCAEVF